MHGRFWIGFATLIMAFATAVYADEPSSESQQDSQLNDRMRAALMKRLDENSDGSVSPSELRKAREDATRRLEQMGLGREALRKRFDKNENGMLEPEERAEMRQYLAERSSRGRGQSRGERKPRLDQSSLLEKFDENKDGVLDPSERLLIIAEIRRMRTE